MRMGENQTLVHEKDKNQGLFHHANRKACQIASKVHVFPQGIGRIRRKLTNGISGNISDRSKCRNEQ